jgi:hypothetical protein
MPTSGTLATYTWAGGDRAALLVARTGRRDGLKDVGIGAAASLYMLGAAPARPGALLQLEYCIFT